MFFPLKIRIAGLNHVTLRRFANAIEILNFSLNDYRISQFQLVICRKLTIFMFQTIAGCIRTSVGTNGEG